MALLALSSWSLTPVDARAQASAEPDAEFVVMRYRNSKMNLRTSMQKLIAKAGLKCWPRLFQNLRASCETELVDRFPAHVVAAWLGHSPSIAQRHYLQLRDAYFDMANGKSADQPGGRVGAPVSTPSVTPAARAA